MKNNKKRILIILAVAIAVLFTACSSTGTGSDGESNAVTYNSIENDLQTEFENFKQTITAPVEQLKSDIGKTYAGYESNTAAVDSYFTLVKDSTNDFYNYMFSKLGEYYQVILSTENMDKYDIYSDKNEKEFCSQLTKYLSDAESEAIKAINDIGNTQDRACEEGKGRVDSEEYDKAWNSIEENVLGARQIISDNEDAAWDVFSEAESEFHHQISHYDSTINERIPDVIEQYSAKLKESLK